MLEPGLLETGPDGALGLSGGVFMVMLSGSDHWEDAPLLSVAMILILYFPALLQV